LSEIDFEEREWVPESGWPVSREELLPFYGSAQAVFGLGPFDYDPEHWATKEFPYIGFPDGRVISGMHQKAVQKRFGLVYRDELANSRDIDTYLYANALSVGTNDAANHVARISCGCLSGTRFSVEAKTFILALGGIENARILLVSRGTQSVGLANQHDLVGRYFSDHPYFSNLGLIVVTEPSANFSLYFKNRVRGTDMQAHFELAPEVQRAERLLHTRIHVRERSWDSYQYDPNADAADRLLRKMESLVRRLTGRQDDMLTPEAFGQPAGARLIRLGAWCEVIPRRDSRVYLGGERDELGLERVVVDWRVGSAEKESLIRSLRVFAEAIGLAGLGRARIDLDEESAWPWAGGGEPGLHHMGTTRMSDDAKRGVVDRNCRVHGINNLFMAGSSVFPTYGIANPTLTIVALALRLADHLNRGVEA
jgi:choline dehydrogenase-like flavoprotein